jgi:hypothetical protein
MIDHRKTIEAARKLIGTKYVRRSSVRGRNACCFGLMLLLAEDIGATLPPLAELARIDSCQAKEIADMKLERIERKEAGCLALIVPGVRKITNRVHVGLITDRRIYPMFGFLHTSASARRAIEVPWRSDWDAKVLGYYRWGV